LGQGVAGNTDTRFFSFKAQLLFRSLEGFQYEHIGTGGKPLDKPEPAVINAAKIAKLGNFRTKKGKMPFVPLSRKAAEPGNAFPGILGADKGPTRISGKGEDAAFLKEPCAPAEYAVVYIVGHDVFNHPISILKKRKKRRPPDAAIGLNEPLRVSPGYRRHNSVQLLFLSINFLGVIIFSSFGKCLMFPVIKKLTSSLLYNS
jgi:hypothetical protein